jgi:cytochrome c peroxidase
VSGAAVLADFVSKPEDVGFARQTPMLVGRVSARGPYGWHGESKTLVDRLLAGFHLHRWDEPNSWPGSKAVAERAAALAIFLRRGLVPPPHEDRELTSVEKRGREIFQSDDTLCWVCHKAAPEYTDRDGHDVFGALPVPVEFAADSEAKFKTPSLRFVGGTPPYAHDGRFPTLAALVEDNGDRMGKTSHLSAADKAALVAFLETL